ncbi:hypothetical protein GQ600_16193 [Phytophthora cactorum]|nr:hypothetical protein GQ600_16193 [Phytophthora cactorum]
MVFALRTAFAQVAPMHNRAAEDQNAHQYSKDRYILAPFSWKRVVESKAPALLFLAPAMLWPESVVAPAFLTTLNISWNALDTTSILRLMEEGVREEQEASRFCLPDQYAVELPNYYSKLRFPPMKPTSTSLSTGFKREIGSQPYTSITVVLSRTCLRALGTVSDLGVFSPATEKIAHFNYVNKEDFFNRMLRRRAAEYSGDVLCLNNLGFHSMLLVYKPGIAEQDKSQERLSQSMGILLSAYCVMEGRDYDPDNFEKAKKRFYEKLQLPDKSSKARTSANAKKYKKRRRTDTLASVRAAKRASEGGALASVS